ncbi:MAG: hypothetical protein JNM70_24040, partial [Anaerolineae bacterium]|nr:hypothetical protein [Anaerolineae bacterium]
MRVQNRTANSVSLDMQWLTRVGGIAAIVLAAAYIIVILLYAAAGAPPTGGEAWLIYLYGKTALWWAILGFSILTDFLFVPVAFALYFALKGVNRTAALIGAAFLGLFAVLDLAVTWPQYAALITLSSGYAAISDAVQQGVYVAAASYADSALQYSQAIYSILVPSFGILLIALVIDLVKRDDAAGTWQASHFRWRVRTV